MKCPNCRKQGEPVPPRGARRKQVVQWFECKKCNIKFMQRVSKE